MSGERKDQPSARPAVCIVSELPPPPGGMAMQATLLGEGLRREGHAVFSVATNGFSRLALLRRVRWVRGFANFLLYLPRLWRACRKADCVHVLSNSYLGFFLFTYPAVIFGRMLGKRVIIHYHGGAAECFLQRWDSLARPALKSASLIVVPSGFLVAVFRRFGIPTVEVPNVLDIGAFPLRERSPLRPRVIMSRHLESEYNVACGLRAFARLKQEFPEARLVIAGNGSERPALERLAGDLVGSQCDIDG